MTILLSTFRRAVFHPCGFLREMQILVQSIIMLVISCGWYILLVKLYVEDVLLKNRIKNKVFRIRTLGINYRKFLSQHLTFKSPFMFNGSERSRLQCFFRESCEQKMLYYVRVVYQSWKAMVKSRECVMLMPTRA